MAFVGIVLGAGSTQHGVGRTALLGMTLIVLLVETVLVWQPAFQPPMRDGARRALLATAAVDMVFSVVVVYLSGGWTSPFYHFAVTSLLVPVVSGPNEWEKWHWNGVIWSLAGGAAGAVGAIGIILAFNFGGKPVYVMPLVFGAAPVINALVTVAPAISQGVAVSPLFFAGLIIVIAGAATVLIFAPKAAPHPPK